jgi:hypothetical protein
MPELSEKQLAEIRQMNAPGLARAKERKIRDLARDLHGGRVPAADPDVRAALEELAAEVARNLQLQRPANGSHDLRPGRAQWLTSPRPAPWSAT